MLLDKIIIRLDRSKKPFRTDLYLKRAMGIKYLLKNGYKQCNNREYYQNGDIYFSYSPYSKCWISDSYHKQITGE